MSESGKKQVYKPKPISGFPEWLPEVRLIEQQWFDHIRRVFESYGFCSVETPSVEEIDVLTAKGEVDKEIYVIERLHRDDSDKEARLALHFDQTVPLARYVAQHFNNLVFPFKRYQMQRVWRGERPQAGRFREFYQCDIDVIGIDSLGLYFDAEMPAIIWEVLSGLPGMEKEKIQIRVNNRKIITGMVESLSAATPEQVAAILRVIDKREKMPAAQYDREVQLAILPLGNNERTNHLYKMIMALPQYSEFLKSLPSIAQQIEYLERNYNVTQLNPTFMAGIEELSAVLENLKHLPKDAIVPDLSIVRGLDYYTGTVYETMFLENPGYGSICSGGRYDDLASGYINKNLPGVGISIGFTRLFSYLLDKGKFNLLKKSPADVLVVFSPTIGIFEHLTSLREAEEIMRQKMIALSSTLRNRGINVETYHMPKKTGDQMKYAARKGIPYVWFPPFDDNGAHEVKNMLTGEQKAADPQSWSPHEN